MSGPAEGSGGGVPRVEVHASPDELATAVAGAFLRLVTVQQDAGEVPQVGLTGGTIADKIHHEIARLAEHSEVDWSRVDFFWGDERFVAADSDERNARQARAVFPDGHVASLFPGFPQLDVDDQLAVAVTGSPKPPPERVSLTFSALNRSEEVWFVVSGADKAEAVGRALAAEPPDVHEIPAAGVRGQVVTTWFLDHDAASRL